MPGARRAPAAALSPGTQASLPARGGGRRKGCPGVDARYRTAAHDLIRRAAAAGDGGGVELERVQQVRAGSVEFEQRIAVCRRCSLWLPGVFQTMEEEGEARP